MAGIKHRDHTGAHTRAPAARPGRKRAASYTSIPRRAPQHDERVDGCGACVMYVYKCAPLLESCLLIGRLVSHRDNVCDLLKLFFSDIDL